MILDIISFIEIIFFTEIFVFLAIILYKIIVQFKKCRNNNELNENEKKIVNDISKTNIEKKQTSTYLYTFIDANNNIIYQSNELLVQHRMNKYYSINLKPDRYSEYKKMTKKIILNEPSFKNDEQYSIPDYAFEDFIGLEWVFLHQNICSIGTSAFKGCINLKSINIPIKTRSIGFNAFKNCLALKIIYYEGTLDYWSSIKFDNEFSNPIQSSSILKLKSKSQDNADYSVIKEYTFSGIIRNIMHYSCCNLQSLETLIFSSDIQSIGISSFKNCNNLHCVVIENKNVSIQESSFSQCTNLERIEFNFSFEDFKKMNLNLVNLREYINSKSVILKFTDFEFCL